MNDGNSVQHMTQLALGRYRLIRRIGIGGMGEVWLGEDPALHRQVAIKTLPLHNQNDNEFLQRFEREARAAAALNHPHILPVHDFGKQLLPNGQTITYIVMPYVSGGSLADRIETYTRNKVGISLAEAINYLVQAADAIDYAHAQGVLHRDIKPANMLLRNDNWLMLADFGIARILSERTQLTQTGTGFGTPDYMAPEQAQGKAEPVSDNYSLAVIAYQLFTGRLPFSGDSSYAISIQHMMTPPPPPRQLNPALSPAIEQILLQGLAKNPAQRPPSARDFVGALQRAMQQAPYATTSPVQPTEPAPFFVPNTERPPQGQFNPVTTPATQRRLTRRQVLIGGGAALLLVGGGLGAWEIASTLNHTGQNQAQTTRTTGTRQKKPTTTTSSTPGSPNFLLTGHDQPATALVWSPKTPILASAGLDGNVMLWDILATQQQEASTKKAKATQFLGVTGNNMLLAWSPDNAYLAIGNVNGHNANYSSAYLSIYTANLSNPLAGYQNLPFNGSVFFNGLAWTPGKYLLAAMNDTNTSTTICWQVDIQAGLLHPDTSTMPKTSVPVFMSLDSSVYYLNPLAVSPDGTTAAIGTIEGVTVGQFTVAGKALHWQQRASLTLNDTIPTEGDAVTWSPDGRFVAAVTTNNYAPPSVLAFWDLQNQNTRHALQIPASNAVLGTLAWSPAPTSTELAAGNKDGTVYIWDVGLSQNVPSGNKFPAIQLHGPQAQIEALAWSADGQWLAAAYKDDNSSIAVWNMSQL
jgi:serine/threonine protein kinase